MRKVVRQDLAYAFETVTSPSRAVQYVYVCQAPALRRKVRIAHAPAL